MEAELADERYSFVETNAYEREQLSNPEGPITIGIDGGYVRSHEMGQSHFEVTVGKSIPTDRPDRYLGLVQSHNEKPKRRLHEILKDQGLQENQQVTFMTDGGKALLQASADAMVKNGGSSYVANPHAHAGRHAAQEVPAMVSGYEIRRRSENGSMIAHALGYSPICLVRGLSGAKEEFLLVASAQNLKRLETLAPT